MQRRRYSQGAVEEEAHCPKVSSSDPMKQRHLLSTSGAMTDGRKHIHYSIKKGAQFATEVKQLETDLTADMIAS